MNTKKELRSKIAALKKEYQQVAQADFKAEFKQLFDEHEELKSVSWTQYTPYFNDGDECSFGAQTDYPCINGNDMNSGDSDELDGPDLVTMAEQEIGYTWNNTNKPNPAYDPKAAKIIAKIKKVLGDYSDDDYEEMFGDHVKVIVTRKGIKTEDYEHE